MAKGGAVALSGCCVLMHFGIRVITGLIIRVVCIHYINVWACGFLL